MKTFIIALLFAFTFNNSAFTQEQKFKGKEISFPSLDGLEITADFYQAEQQDAPCIILFHQANYSRGSYRSIAPKLNALGYSCLAVDQRSGHKAKDIINKTNKRAIKEGKRSRFVDAVPDVEAALQYVKDELKATQIVLWGSSYSASLVIYLGSKYPENLLGILSFSPGEYFEIKDQKIASFAPRIKCPVLIASAKNEQKQWDAIYENISSDKSYYLPEGKGAHGSKALWPEKEGSEGYWEAVTSFLEKIRK